MLKKSKKERVRAYLNSGKGLSQRSAITKFRAYRLAPIVHLLRGEGMKIHTDMKRGYAIYRLVG